MQKKNKNKKLRPITRLFIGLFLGANICTVLLMWLTVASTFFSPSEYPTLSLLGLFFPIFVAVDIAFVFFWLIFRFYLIWIPLLGLAAVSGYAMDYCPLNTKEYLSDSAICVVSYNLGGVQDEEDKQEIVRYLKEKTPDIVCFQEMSGTLMNMPDFLHFVDSVGYNKVTGLGKYILTRFPILGDTLHIDYPTRTNSSMACWILCQGDSLLLVSNHLESNRLSNSDKTEYKDMILEPEREKVEQGGRLLKRKLGDAAYYRGAQIDTLCALIERNAGKSILMCGDFNDTPISYSYQQLAKRLDSAFRKTGRGAGFTYRQSGIYVRIDHIFISEDWQCIKCFVDDKIRASDHFPVVAYIQKKH
jgi:endonuclease/exonuclease/phosphatase family metal-dependent hydrolase